MHFGQITSCPLRRSFKNWTKSTFVLFTYCIPECSKDVILNNFKSPARVVWVCNGARVVRVIEVIFAAIINDLKSSGTFVTGKNLILLSIRQAIDSEAFTNISDTHIISPLSSLFHQEKLPRYSHTSVPLNYIIVVDKLQVSFVFFRLSCLFWPETGHFHALVLKPQASRLGEAFVLLIQHLVLDLALL